MSAHAIIAAAVLLLGSALLVRTIDPILPPVVINRRRAPA